MACLTTRLTHLEFDVAKAQTNGNGTCIISVLGPQIYEEEMQSCSFAISTQGRDSPDEKKYSRSAEA